MPSLTPHTANNDQIETLAENHYKLRISAGQAGTYRLAQLDDYAGLSRKAFPRHAPLRIRLEMRMSSNDIGGTWGMGLWNDPFSLLLGLGGGVRRLPTLPNSAWFFFASPENHLSFTDHLPGNGMLAGIFRSAKIPTPLFAPAGLVLPLLALKPFARLARRAARLFIKEDSTRLTRDWTQWHTFDLHWQETGCTFFIDDQQVFDTALTPRAPLGLVVWIDNQFAAFPPDGKLAFGALENRAATLEIKNLDINID